jgi:hypothetical protein
MKRLLTLVYVFVALSNQAQDNKIPQFKNYDWEAKPTIQTPEKGTDTLNYFVVNDKNITEYAYESTGNLVMYTTAHVRIHFNNVKGIEEKSKVYISTYNTIDMMDVKARSINKDGRVTLLPASNIKKSDNLEGKGPFTYFAMEGLEPGSEMEYLYTKKMEPYIYGSHVVQRNSLCKKYSFDLISPSNLVFEAKSYNGLPAFVKDTGLAERNCIRLEVNNIRPLTEEKYSALDASRMKFAYKLAYNYAKSRARLYTFDIAAADFYKRFYEIEKQNSKMLPKIISKAGISASMSDEAKVRQLETYLKANLFVEKDAKELSFKEMIENKMANRSDMIRLYLHALKEIGQEVELVITCDRFDQKFDSEFDTWNQLDDILLFIPKLNVYISPTSIQSRYEFMPAELSANKGLFIKEVSLGDIKSGVSKVKTIGFTDYKKSTHDQKCEVTFKDGSFTPQVSNVTSLTGYSAYYSQPYYYLLEKSQQEEIVKPYVKTEGNESTIISSSVENTKPEDILIKPMIITSKTEAPQLLEKAGNKLIFKVGDLIGPQAEMYQEGQRLTNPEIQYTHAFIRQLKIKIPNGYKLVNTEDIDRLVLFDKSDNPACQFKVSHTLSGQDLLVEVYEDYRLLVYPLTEYEKFKSVINASADFNKLTLIFEKQ